jgi:hypothetical protein
MRFQSNAAPIAILTLGITSGCVSHPPTAMAPPETEEVFVAILTVEAEDVPVYAEASRTAPVVESLQPGDRLRLVQSSPTWFLVVTPSEVRGYVEPSALISPDCTKDRVEPIPFETPVFWFSKEPPHGRIVLEAEYTSEAQLVSVRVLENTVGDPRFEQHALDDLRSIRFLPPTVDCEPRPFIYTFTRRF